MPTGFGMRLHFETPGAVDTIAQMLKEVLDSERPVFVCIGTDRSTGDAFGPVVGSMLEESGKVADVLGTLAEPIHASNLRENIERIKTRYPARKVVAIDACLGRLESVGTLAFGAGSLTPGAGVNKTLPEVGNFFMTGTVNVGGFMEYFVLQNTRLYLVQRMAKVLAAGIIKWSTAFGTMINFGGTEELVVSGLSQTAAAKAQ